MASLLDRARALLRRLSPPSISELDDTALARFMDDESAPPDLRADAARELLHPSDPSGRTRLVVRGLDVRHISIVSLDAASEPATMTIDVKLAGRRYLEDRDTAAVVSGSQSRAVTFTERWTLALDGADDQPWRIATVGAPAARP
jgi:hypothetical protein